MFVFRIIVHHRCKVKNFFGLFLDFFRATWAYVFARWTIKYFSKQFSITEILQDNFPL